MNIRRSIIIFVVALTLRLIYLAVNCGAPDDFKAPDSVMYEQLADTFLETGGFNRAEGVPETERVPGYIAYLALFHLFAGDSPLWPVLGQLIINSLTCVLIALLAAQLKPQLFLLTGILAALNLNMIANSAIILTDTLFLAFFTAMLVAMACYIQKPNTMNAALAGICLGLALLTRSVVMFFPPVLLLSLLLAAWFKRISIGRVAGHVTVCTLTIALLIFPLIQRNVNEFGHYGLVTQGGAHSLYWIVPLAREYADGVPMAETQKEMRDRMGIHLKKKGLKELPVNPFERNALFMPVAKNAILELGAWKIIKAWAVGSAINISAPAIISVPLVSKMERPSFYETAGDTPIAKIINYFTKTSSRLFVVLILLAGFATALARVLQLVGLFRIGRSQGLPSAPCLFLIATAVYFLAVTGPVTGVKYRLPIEPFLVILLAEALLTIWTRFIKSDRPTHLQP